jgi:hypothetical protein
MSTITPKQQKTLVIKAGDTAVLPAGVKIVSVGYDGNVSATSTCPDVQKALTNGETYACYAFRVSCDADTGNNQLLDESNARITHIRIGGQLYTFPTDAGNPGIVVNWLNGSASNDFGYLRDRFHNLVSQTLIKVIGREYTQRSEYKQFDIIARMLPSVAATCELRIAGNGFENLWVKPVKRDNCNVKADAGSIFNQLPLP